MKYYVFRNNFKTGNALPNDKLKDTYIFKLMTTDSEHAS